MFLCLRSLQGRRLTRSAPLAVLNGAISCTTRVVLGGLIIASAFAYLETARATDIRLENKTVLVSGPLQVRFAFTDQNGASQDIPLQQLSTEMFLGRASPAGSRACSGRDGHCCCL